MKAITPGQKSQGVTVITDATRKGSTSAIEELAENGTLNGDNMQRILGQGDHVSAKVHEFVKKLLAEMAENATDRLKLISGAETLTLGPTDGNEIIAEAGDLFKGYLDSDFVNWNTNVKGNPTEAQNVQVHEMTKDGTFEQIYGGLGTDLNALCLTQAQIIGFVKKHRKWLREDGYGTFFLFKVGDDFFVADVRVSSDGTLYAFVHRFSYDYVWFAVYRHRFVVPQLALASA
ncbi:MAG: hypothetical protein KBB54_02615 [Candidatus Pacebacteria bacterium]|nr:hypothetical protein [Candidatus Paceibacterota bacterium]MBP9818844.1 hypothetical protein [Candidatus Paceibacterota bacterium]